MALRVQQANQGILSQIQVAPVQTPQLTTPNTGVAPYLPGHTPNTPAPLGAWAAHDFTGSNGVPMQMPAYSGHGWTPIPMARHLTMPPLYSFNKLSSL